MFYFYFLTEQFTAVELEHMKLTSTVDPPQFRKFVRSDVEISLLVLHEKFCLTVAKKKNSDRVLVDII